MIVWAGLSVYHIDFIYLKDIQIYWLITFWTWEFPSDFIKSNFCSGDSVLFSDVSFGDDDDDGTLLLIGWLDDVTVDVVGWDGAGDELTACPVLSTISGISHDLTDGTLGNFSLHLEPSTSIKCFWHLDINVLLM